MSRAQDVGEAAGAPRARVRRAFGWWRRRSRARRWALGVAVAAAAALVAGTAYASVLVTRVSRFDVDLRASAPGGRSYLIVGTDSRAGLSPEAQRSRFGSTPLARADVVLLLRVPDDGPPVLVSVPRDLLVVGADGGLHRLALEWLEGPQAFVDAMCRSLGLGADHLVRVELDGFIDLVDAVGGIDVEFPHALHDTVIDFSVEEGVQHLDGVRALQYVRARHLAYRNAFGWFPYDDARDGRAQIVLRAVAARASVGRGPRVLHRLLWSATGHLAVDDGTGPRDLLRALGAAQAVDPQRSLTLPVERTDSAIPFAELAPGAAAVLARGGAGGPDCQVPALATARGTPLPAP